MKPLSSEAQAYLARLKRRGVQPGLERMRALATVLGNPQHRTPVVHVAGTNGKGSVAAMMEAALRAAGWKTGLYTSPHLVRLGERVQINREPLASDELGKLVLELAARLERSGLADRDQPSYFEFMTALAFERFAAAACDVAIVEVGMGGRLDATNIVVPELSIITSIGLDHCEFLGGTLEAIAGEKAGIIKMGIPVVIGRLPDEAEQVVRSIARQCGSSLTAVADVFGRDVGRYPTTNLAGEHQRLNAATATLACRQLGERWRLHEEVITAALARVQWPARWQRLSVGGRTVIVDAAHNEEGARMLDRQLASLVAETGQRPVVVFGSLGAARAQPLLAAICRHASEVRLVVPRQARACSHEALLQLAPLTDGTDGARLVRSSWEEIFPGPGQCLPNLATRVPVVVTGSLYLAGEALARLDPQLGPVEADLQDF